MSGQQGRSELGSRIPGQARGIEEAQPREGWDPSRDGSPDAGNGPDWAIQVEELTKAYGHLLALRGISLQLQRGKFLTIFGPNGAGKTTLIRILSTLLRPTSGRVEILGMEIGTAGEEIRRQIGVLSHQTFLYNNLTPWENLKFYGTLYGLDHLEERIELLLEQVGLEGRKNDPVRTFSRGMQQRLAIARTLLHDPQVVFLDEPYTGLDQHAARMLEELLGQMRTGQRTILLVTHNLARGLGMGDEVAIQVGGRILYREERARIDPASFEELYFRCVEEGPAWDS